MTTSASCTSSRSISSRRTSVRSRSKGPEKTSRSSSSEATVIQGRLTPAGDVQPSCVPASARGDEQRDAEQEKQDEQDRQDIEPRDAAAFIVTCHVPERS